jgi:hypothetical protein
MNQMLERILNGLAAVPEFFFSDRKSAYLIRWVVSLTLFIGVFALAYSILLRVDWLQDDLLLMGEYLIVLFAAFLFSFISAARYLKDLYEMDKVIAAFWYLIYSILFFMFWPSNTASNGQLQKKKGKRKWNLIHILGGPGKIKVSPRNLVIFEKLEGPSQVLGVGKHEITRYQFVKMVLSLDDQYVNTGEIKSTTLDGIKVVVPEISVRYKLREHEPDWIRDRGKTVDGTSYIEAARKFATNRLVAIEGSEALTMGEMVKAIIMAATKKYLNRHMIDQIIVPHDLEKSSRQALINELMGPEVRSQMKQIGARLIGLEIGAFHFLNPEVEDFRLAKWRETKQGEIKLMKAESEAYELARRDAVRSKTQVEMTRRIIDALEDLHLEDEKDLDTLIQLRTAQILDAWSGLYRDSDGKDGKDKKDKTNGQDDKRNDKSAGNRS